MTTAAVEPIPFPTLDARPERHLRAVPAVDARNKPVQVRLPDELAPTLRVAVQNLLAQVSLAEHREHIINPDFDKGATRCFKCGRSGKLGGHHLPDGSIALVHEKCHRAIHRAPEYVTA